MTRDDRAQEEQSEPAPDPPVARLLTLQRAAGNAVVARYVAGSDAAFDPTGGTDVVHGFEDHAAFSKQDREALIAAVGERRRQHDANVIGFLGNWSAALTEIWGKEITRRLAKVAAAGQYGFWGKLAKFAIQASVLGMLTGGAGALVRVGSAGLNFFAEKATDFAINLAGDDVESGGDKGDVAKAGSKLDERTATLAAYIRQLHSATGSALNIPWERYGAWITTATDDDLRRFRLPDIFPHIAEADIRGAVAGVVAALSYERFDGDSDFIAYDASDQVGGVSFFGDNLAIAHLTAGPWHSVAKFDSLQFYSSSPQLRKALVGKPLGLMASLPLYALVGTQGGNDLAAARELVAALERAMARRSDANPSGPDPNEVERMLATYPKATSEFQITRSFTAPTPTAAGGSGVGAAGGGLAEHVWMYCWAVGDNLDNLAAAVLDEEGPGAETLSPGAMAPHVHAHLQHWLPLGAQSFIDNFLNPRTLEAGENRFTDAYWARDERFRFLDYEATSEYDIRTHPMDYPPGYHPARRPPDR